VTWAALAATAGFMALFAIHDRPLQPYGIVGYEFAWTPGRALEMFRAWGEAGRQVARESLWIDFGFMPAYALLGAGLTLSAARGAQSGWAQRLGMWAARLPFGAWALDAVENVALLRALGSPEQPPAAPLAVAGAAATVKFGLLAVCAVYMVGAWVGRLRRAQGTEGPRGNKGSQA
jgi:hypothetical protein